MNDSGYSYSVKKHDSILGSGFYVYGHKEQQMLASNIATEETAELIASALREAHNGNARLREVLADAIDAGCGCETTTITKCDACGWKGSVKASGSRCGFSIMDDLSDFCAGTMQPVTTNHAQHPWLLYAVSDFPDGCGNDECPASSRTEDAANDQRLQFIDSVVAAIAKATKENQ